MAEIFEIFRQQLTSGSGGQVPSQDRPLDYTDEALALRFTREHGENLRYVSLWGKWLFWDGRRWKIDETELVKDYCRAIARAASSEILEQEEPNYKLAATVASAKTIYAIEKLARADRKHASTPDDWDANPWIINTHDGTVDLTTGLMRPHDRKDYCTKMTAVSPGGLCPLWTSFLNRVFKSDTALIKFVQRYVGYCLTGSTRDHALVFGYGTGANGKGVLYNTVSRILGTYAVIAPMETFTASQNERHPTDLAMLRGARLVTAQETEEGHRWAESKIKALTGGDTVTARFMRQDFFSYMPQFKLMIAGNHKPSLRNVDEAIKRRFNLVPFAVTIPENERDPELQEKLKAEWPGILQWAIEGCLEWQAIGLQPPTAVRMATEGYLSDEDTIQRFLDEKCQKAPPDEFVEISVLFAAWREWCAATGEYAGAIKRFSQNLMDRKFERLQHPINRRACVSGLRLVAQPCAEENPYAR